MERAGKGWLTWLAASDNYRPINNRGKPMFGLKNVVAAISVAAMIGSSAFAADRTLAPGQPAGVKPAQDIGRGTLIIGIGAAAIITGVAIAVANNSGNAAPTPGTFAGPSTTSIAP
jgi:hypothetical protein